MIKIIDIWLSQNKLRNPAQIKNLVNSIENSEYISPIYVIYSNGEYQVMNGHHRLLAYALAKRNEIYNYEYLLIYKSLTPKKGKINRLVTYYKELGLV